MKKYSKSDLINNNRHSFPKYNNIKKVNKPSFDSKCNPLILFYRELNKLNGLKSSE